MVRLEYSNQRLNTVVNHLVPEFSKLLAVLGQALSSDSAKGTRISLRKGRLLNSNQRNTHFGTSLLFYFSSRQKKKSIAAATK